jgi:L,D-transpeptidase catalytic domain/Putative peptidoglycan binding domain
LLVLAVLAGGAVMLVSARASLTADASALAKFGLPLGGGRISSVGVVTGPNSRPIPIAIKGQQIWPRGLIPAHERVSIELVVKRPGWISWLAGSTERLTLSLTTPSAHLTQQYVTLPSGAPLRLHFVAPVAVIAYGPQGGLRRHVLASPESGVTLGRAAAAGSIWVAAAPRTWESAGATLVSWFPAGSRAAAVAYPAPGTSIGPSTPITLTFSKPVDQALASSRPPVFPITPGTWHQVGSHTIVFRPEGYGYGLGAKVAVALPSGVQLASGQQSATWSVPAGSKLRLQQLLATLGYLPLDFNPTAGAVALTPQAQEAEAVNPPAGSFSWRFGNVPSALRAFWQPGTSGEMTRGAVMAFENDHGLVADGDAGPAVWRALLAAVITGHRSSFGYTFVSVDRGSQHLDLWHDGHSVLTAAVNTGIASAQTAPGTFAVYEHIASGTMSGTNPDGSHYHDPGIQWISYFNGGDALHGFTRAQYGFPQSLGCVEMPNSVAGQVWPYTPIGTLVHVS